MSQPTPNDVARILEQARRQLGAQTKQTEIAFFGGSFTAIDRTYMLSLLEAAKPYLDDFYGIRISTRPDAVDREVLSLLQTYHLTAVELGAQSMDNSVLELNQRSHTAQDVITACRLIGDSGVSFGLQMMTGLYGATPQSDMATAQQFVALQPDTVRVYPTVILKDTDLARLYQSGAYVPYTLAQSVELCAKLILLFAKADIQLIRLGLHYSDSLAQNSLGGNYHPAFKELCESKIFNDRFLQQAVRIHSKQLVLTVHPKSVSKLIGQRKCNLLQWQAMGYTVTIHTDERLNTYDLGVRNATEITGSTGL